MKAKDIKPLREKIWLQNNKKCPILDKEIPLDTTALDHCHKLKSQISDETLGAIRTTLDFRCNALAGKIENGFKRYGLHNVEGFDLPTFLRNTADYLERGSYVEEDENTKTYYTHPNEVTKRAKVKISEWKRILKYYFTLNPTKKVLPKKPTYVNDKFIEMLKQTTEHIENLKTK